MLPRPPIVVAHSFGGLILQKYILGIAPDGGDDGLPKLAGAAFLCSVPPSGNKKLVGRFFMRDPLLSLRVTYGFIAKTAPKASSRGIMMKEDLGPVDTRACRFVSAECLGDSLHNLFQQYEREDEASRILQYLEV
eukprot:351801-Chlamydomonas_euryale.AAC.17